MISILLLLAAAQAQDAFRFVVVGDTQAATSSTSVNAEVLEGVVEGANARGAELLIVAGDLINGSSSLSVAQAGWDEFKAITAAFEGEVLVVPGNHDLYSGAATFEAWRSTFSWLPQTDSPAGEEGVSYYVDHGNSRFIFVTSNFPTYSGRLSSEGLAWLDRVLAESSAFEHVFVTTHHPVSFSDESSHGGATGDLWQLLVANGVDGLFVGHWHRYQPGQLGAGGNTWETILGTGGGWQGYEPIRPYQQIHGFVEVAVEGPSAVATFYGDEDGDGAYDDPLDSFEMALAVPGGLRARYTFEGGDARDSAPDGKGIDGVLEGGASVSTDAGGPSGSWLDLRGPADFVEAGSIGDYVLSVNGDLSAAAWVRVDEVPEDTGWGDVLFCYGTGDYYTEDEETNYSWWLSVLPDGRLMAFWEHGSGSNITVKSTVASGLLDGGWHPVALVRDEAAAEVRFYVDGVQLGEAVAYTQAPTSGARGMLYLGSDTREYAGDYDLVGALDEVCVFDLALDAGQVAELAALVDCEVVAGGDEGGGDEGGDEGGGDEGGGDEGGGDAGGEPGVVEAGGCGCRGGGAAWMLLLPGLIGWRRRSQGAESR